MAIAYVNGAQTIANPSSSTTVQAAITATAGNLLVAFASWADNGATAAVTDSAGNTWAPGTKHVSAGGTAAQMFYAPNVTASSTTLTCTFSAAVSYSQLLVEQYSGAATTSVLRVEATPVDGTSIVATANPLSVQATDLIVCCCSGNVPATAGTGFSLRHTGNYSSSEDQIVSATGSVTPTMNMATSNNWNALAMAFIASGGSAPATIARTNAALYYSPGNWCDDGTSRMSANPGAYVKFSFTGTSLTMLTTALASMSAYPQIRAIIDGIRYDVGLSTATSFALASGLAAGTHTAEIHLRASLYSAGSWWMLVNALKITGFQIDNGATVSAYSPRPKIGFAFGDSETQSYFLDGNSSPANDDALGNYVSPLFEALNAEYGQIGWGGTNYAAAGVSDVPAFNTSYASIASGFSRLTSGQFTTQPDYVTVMLGTNGAPAQSDVATAISNLRAAAPSAWLFMIVPPCGTGRATITAAANAAITAGDAKVVLVDAGTRYQTGLNPSSSANSGTEAAPADGVHMGRRANARLGAAWALQIQHAIEPRRFTIIAS